LIGGKAEKAPRRKAGMEIVKQITSRESMKNRIIEKAQKPSI